MPINDCFQARGEGQELVEELSKDKEVVACCGPKR